MSGTGIKMKWHGPEIIRAVQTTIRRRLRLAAEVVASECRKNLSTPTRSAGPSLPGGFPHADTGRLRASIFGQVVSDDTAIVGTPLAYGAYLEYGTSKMAARPFLRPTLAENADRVRDILLGNGELDEK